MSQKHSPSPWKAHQTGVGNKSEIFDDKNYRIAIVSDPGHDDTYNALLMAAAPELLAALEDIVADYKDLGLGQVTQSSINKAIRAMAKTKRE